MLTPGSYALTYRARSGDGPSARPWRLRCSIRTPSQTSKRRLRKREMAEFGAKFIVPIQDCPIQRLALERPDDMHSQEVWIDDVMIKPALQIIVNQ